MTESNSRVLINSVDRAWLEMDEPRNPMVIAAMVQLEGPVDAADFQRTVVERLRRYPRFRQRVGKLGGALCWIEDQEPDFGYHIQVRRLPEDGFDHHLRKAISDEVSRDLDPLRPLWRLLIFPEPGGPITVLFRAHHAMADGVALVTLLIDSTDAGLVRAPAPREHSGKRPHRGPLGRYIDRLEMLNKGLMQLGGLSRGLWRPHGITRQLRQGRATLVAVQRLLRLPDNNPLALSAPLCGRRSVAWIEGLPFAGVRHLAHTLDVRVNDVFMAVLAGAFGRELRRFDPALAEEQNLRISIPVNLRNGRGRELGNRFGLVLLDLPVGLRDPEQRLRVVVQRMNALKASLEAKVTLLGLAAAGHLPVPIEKKLVRLIGGKAAAVVSNLPGPKQRVHFAGARMKNLVFWPPQAGGMGIGISFFTYAGELSVGISTDRNVLPNPPSLLQAFREELDLLCKLDHRARADHRHLHLVSSNAAP